MCIAYFVFSLIISGLRHMVAVYDHQGNLPNVHGMRLICLITDLVFLVGAMYYWGLIAGAVYFVLYFFSILFCCYSWIITYPSTFFATSEYRVKRIIMWESGLLFWLMIAFFIFLVVSFFVVPAASMWSFFKSSWIVIVSIGLGLLFLRLFCYFVEKKSGSFDESPLNFLDQDFEVNILRSAIKGISEHILYSDEGCFCTDLILADLDRHEFSSRKFLQKVKSQSSDFDYDSFAYQLLIPVCQRLLSSKKVQQTQGDRIDYYSMVRTVLLEVVDHCEDYELITSDEVSSILSAIEP